MNTDEAVRLRRAINKLARQFNTSATDEGLTPTQASVLGLIAACGPISLSEVVQMEHLNPTMLSRVVGKLDDSGLIVRLVDPDDMRSVSLTATGAGHETNERIRSQRAAAVSRSAARLTDREQRDLVQALPALERLAEGFV